MSILTELIPLVCKNEFELLIHSYYAKFNEQSLFFFFFFPFLLKLLGYCACSDINYNPTPFCSQLPRQLMITANNVQPPKPLTFLVSGNNFSANGYVSCVQGVCGVFPTIHSMNVNCLGQFTGTTSSPGMFQSCVISQRIPKLQRCDVIYTCTSGPCLKSSEKTHPISQGIVKS